MHAALRNVREMISENFNSSHFLDNINVGIQPVSNTCNRQTDNKQETIAKKESIITVIIGITILK